MTRYADVVQDERKFLALTGYTVPEFQALLPYFRVCFSTYVTQYTLEGKRRQQRRYTEYQNSPLPTIADKLLFILMYLKTYPLQAVQGQLFGMHQSEANRWIHLLLPLINQALAACDELPARKIEELGLDDESAACFFHDGTERPIQRPQDPETQQTYYSGKKKTHTVKNDVIGNEAAKVIFLTDTVEGKKHDKKLADEAGYTLPAGSVLYQDTGFQGFKPAGVTILQPKKKPRGGALSPDDNALNRWISAIRIRIEHIINGVKRYRIVKDRSRNWKAGFRDRVFETCCGLHNFRLRFRPWHYDSIPHLQFMLKSL
jgi:hypothetical protein